MKKVLKILFVFLSFFFLQGVTQNMPSQDVFDAINYIQNDYQNIVLTSQNLNQDLIITSKSDNSSNFTYDEDFGLIQNNKTNSFSKTNPHSQRGNIHNLSIYLNSAIFIRAP